MRTALKSVWPVIVAAGIVQTANGLQTDLLSLRAGLEAFPAWALGVIMACYYIGYSAAPLASHAIVARLGHITTIVAFTFVSALVIILHGLEVTVIAWSILRVASGFVLAIVFVGYESWINDCTENRVRGRVFSLYLVSQMIGITLAQVLLNAGSPRAITLFALSAVIFAVGASPLWFANGKAPAKAPPVPFSIFALIRLSPMGAAATVIVRRIVGHRLHVWPRLRTASGIFDFGDQFFHGRGDGWRRSYAISARLAIGCDRAARDDLPHVARRHCRVAAWSLVFTACRISINMSRSR